MDMAKYGKRRRSASSKKHKYKKVKKRVTFWAPEASIIIPMENSPKVHPIPLPVCSVGILKPCTNTWMANCGNITINEDGVKTDEFDIIDVGSDAIDVKYDAVDIEPDDSVDVDINIDANTDTICASTDANVDANTNTVGANTDAVDASTNTVVVNANTADVNTDAVVTNTDTVNANTGIVVVNTDAYTDPVDASTNIVDADMEVDTGIVNANNDAIDANADAVDAAVDTVDADTNADIDTICSETDFTTNAPINLIDAVDSALEAKALEEINSRRLKTLPPPGKNLSPIDIPKEGASAGSTEVIDSTGENASLSPSGMVSGGLYLSSPEDCDINDDSFKFNRPAHASTSEIDIESNEDSTVSPLNSVTNDSSIIAMLDAPPTLKKESSPGHLDAGKLESNEDLRESIPDSADDSSTITGLDIPTKRKEGNYPSPIYKKVKSEKKLRKAKRLFRKECKKRVTFAADLISDSKPGNQSSAIRSSILVESNSAVSKMLKQKKKKKKRKRELEYLERKKSTVNIVEKIKQEVSPT